MFKKIYHLLILLIFIISVVGCQLSSQEEYYDTLEVELATEIQLYNELSQATNSIKGALRYFSGVMVKQALNNAAANGIDIQIILDNEAASTTNGLNAGIGCRLGNAYGILDSNFFIVDGKVYQLSGSELSSGNFMILKMYDEDLLWDYEMEFSQMYNDSNFAYGSDFEDAKIRHNYMEQYTIGQNKVEVYFNPAQPALEHLKTRIGNAKYSTDWFVEYVEHREIYLLWKDIANAGISNTIKLGALSGDNLSDYPDLVNSAMDAEVYLQSLGFNAIFVDKGDQAGSVILTSFELTNHRTVRQSDGVLIVLSGPIVTNVYDQLISSFNTNATSNNVSLQPRSLKTNIQYTNIIFNEIVRRGITNSTNGMRYALAKMIELKNLTTNWFDLSGCEIILTNANRVAEPSTFVVPCGTILPPNGFYVLASVNYAFEYYDEHWDGFYIDRSFTLTFMNSDGTVVDHIGTILSNGFYYDIFNGYYTNSIIRITSPMNSGTSPTDWQSYFGLSKNMYSQFAKDTHATPGSD